MKLLLDAPINDLSFGNVALNLIRELKKRNVDLGLFPIRGRVNLSAFDVDDSLKKYLEDSINNRYSYLAWILTIILSLYFIKNNLMPFIKSFNFPNKVKNLF